MADFNNAIMTTEGAALLARTTAGTAKLKFTKLVTGSGTYTDSEKTRGSLQARTSLKAQKQEFPFSTITMASDTCVKLVALVSNAELSVGYYVNEVGIYAVDELDASATPVLYSIAIANVADYLPPYNGLTPSTITQEYFATVDNALEVTIQTGTGAVALAEDLEALEEQTAAKFQEVDDELARAMQDNDRLYPGRDLTTVFALEIANYSDAWAWIKARIKAHNFTGIHVADYIPITMNGETVKMQVAGIDSYYRTTDQQLSHHIDFISKDCFSQTVQWNTTNNNNGDSTSPYPYMVSNLHTFLTTTLYNYLPAAVKAVISNKRMLMEQRYSASGALTDGISWGWQDLGPLWVPTEYEVFGSVIWGTKGWSEGQGLQYPIFANSFLNRIKGAGNGGGRCDWWLASVGSGTSTNCVRVNNYGHSNGWGASIELRVPVCFRIDEA